MNETTKQDVIETVVVRDQAEALLGHLQVRRQQSARRLSESGAPDPMTSITGRSAIDSAIATTRQMIVHMDELIDELQRQTEPVPATAPVPVLLVEAGSAP